MESRILYVQTMLWRRDSAGGTQELAEALFPGLMSRWAFAEHEWRDIETEMIDQGPVKHH